MATILLVEDSSEDRKPLAKLLKAKGYEVVCAKNAYEAMAACKQKMPDLIVLDVMIPPMDGLTFLMLLRQEPCGADVPVIVLTGADDETTNTRARDLHVREILKKADFDPNYLLELIAKNLPAKTA